jgi:hypothetical protein
MIYFRNNGDVREKYFITFDKEGLEKLQVQVAKRCGEQSIVKRECKYSRIPRSESLHHEYDKDEYHYIDEVHYKLSGNKGTEWDHYDEYEVDLYNCSYKDYFCPPLVGFIEKILCYDNNVYSTFFSQNFQKLCHFPKVKEKLMKLQQEIAAVSQEYLKARQKRADELNKEYEEITKKEGDIEKRIKEVNAWTSKMKKVLLKMDKEHVARMKELNDRLKYLLSIEKLNEDQEDPSNYINTLIGLVDIKLIDTISLEEIERVRSFQSKEIPEQEMQLLMKKQ